MAGFNIRNDTVWPVELTLGLMSPFYFGVARPGEVFSRSTGAVWFTIQAMVSLDGKSHITTGLAVFEAFKSAFFPIKLGNWLINQEHLVDANQITGEVANALKAGSPLRIAGRPLSTMSEEDAVSALKTIFTSERACTRQLGCYAGWRGHKNYAVSGGPTLAISADGKGVDLVSGTPLSLGKV